MLVTAAYARVALPPSLAKDGSTSAAAVLGSDINP